MSDATKLMHLKRILDLDSINKFLSWKVLKDNTMNTITDINSLTCPICLESGGLFVQTKCNHNIHKECMNNYLNNKCPMCRNDMYEEYEFFDVSTLTMRDIVNIKQMIYYERLTRIPLTCLAFNFAFDMHDDIRDLFINVDESRAFEINLKLNHHYKPNKIKYLDSFYIKGPYTYYNLVNNVLSIIKKINNKDGFNPLMFSIEVSNPNQVNLEVDNTDNINIFDILTL